MQPWIAFGVVAAVLASGCYSEPSVYEISGTFKASRTDADLADFHATVKPYSNDVAIMESFPEQFRIHGLGASCPDLARILAAKPYLASSSACVASQPPRY